MRCALIMTVKNEADSLPRLFETLAFQTKQPDEIIVADGGSTDDTVRMLRAASPKLNLRVLELPNANISQGRNAAIRAADAEIIASMDAGVRLDPHWFENITTPFFAENPTDVVSGFFLPDPHGAFEIALAATTLPELREIRAESFLPSSRSVAFRKAAWEKINGYPEWLDYCEDLIFDFDLKRAGFRFHFQPSALVYFRPRSSLSKFFKQYYLYARGDGKANLWWKRHLLRYATYLVAIPLSFILLAYVPAVSLLMWLVGAYALFGTPYRRLLRAWDKLSVTEKMTALFYVPIIRVTGDVAKMIGYPVGVWWRLSGGRRQTGDDK
ncbi:MAG: glycosyltransferase [Chloroflexota bacterium]|nr:MAG: glycosyltransferase [Chloroflexota bacterium]